jgi:hypothetical protein
MSPWVTDRHQLTGQGTDLVLQQVELPPPLQPLGEQPKPPFRTRTRPAHLRLTAPSRRSGARCLPVHDRLPRRACLEAYLTSTPAIVVSTDCSSRPESDLSGRRSFWYPDGSRPSLPLARLPGRREPALKEAAPRHRP